VDLERDVEAYFKRQWKAAGGGSRKLRWLCRKGAPDRFAWLPGLVASVFLVELKRPKGSTARIQQYEHKVLRKDGLQVYVVHTREAVDNFIRQAVDMHRERCRILSVEGPHRPTQEEALVLRNPFGGPLDRLAL